jgi:CMP-N,N'-diacetyllegionaminic acid synthase
LKTEYTRPEYLASHTAGKLDTITDLLLFEEKQKNKRYDYLLDLDATSPLRTQQDLHASFEMIRGDENAYNLFSVNPANKNPYFNMVEQTENSYFNLSKRPAGTVMTRQSVPKVYEMNASFYFYRRKFFDDGLRSAITDRSLIYVMPHICFDLDHPIDFDFLSFLLAHNKIDFEI